jgi:hypothetical protein
LATLAMQMTPNTNCTQGFDSAEVDREEFTFALIFAPLDAPNI